MPDRAILHVDMDAFYASVEQLDHPEYRGQPVIVGADPKEGQGRGVVAACSYEARKFGVRSALPIRNAWKLCPQGIYVRPRMERYMEVSRQVMTIFAQFTDLVEPLSIDEAFLDVTGSVKLLGSPRTMAAAIKAELRKTTGLTASVGVGPNKFVAKVASDLQKPDGLVSVEQDEVLDFLRDLPISRLWGVGPKTEQRLHGMGLKTIADLREAPLSELARSLGSLGEHLYQLARGIDDRPVVPGWEPKSIGAEHTFEEDTADRESLIATLHQLSDRVGERLRRQKYRARRVTLKLRYSDFETHTRQNSVSRPLSSNAEIVRIAVSLFDAFPLDRKIRLLGVSVGNFSEDSAETSGQMDLFGKNEKQETLDRAVDSIRERFGDTALKRGSHLK